VAEVQKKRDEMMSSLVASYHAYEDLLEKTTKGQLQAISMQVLVTFIQSYQESSANN